MVLNIIANIRNILRFVFKVDWFESHETTNQIIKNVYYKYSNYRVATNGNDAILCT